MVFSVAYYLEFCNATLSINKYVGFYQASAIMSKLPVCKHSNLQHKVIALHNSKVLKVALNTIIGVLIQQTPLMSW